MGGSPPVNHGPNRHFGELGPYDRGTQSLARKLALAGYQVSPTLIVDPRKPYCDDPPEVVRWIKAGRGVRALEVRMYRPCRKCPKCLQFRQMMWRSRAIFEIARAKRTWFITLTFSPHHLAGVLTEASLRREEHRAQRIDAAAYPHVSRYLKRVRKAVSHAKLRFLAVFEEGDKTGRAHYHLLLHECGHRPVTKQVIEAKWRSNVHARLVTGEANDIAKYTTKTTGYLTKSLHVRPRASVRYGQGEGKTPPPGGTSL